MMIMETRTEALELWPAWTAAAGELWGYRPAVPAGVTVCPSVLLGRSCTRGGPERCMCRDPRWWLLGEGFDVVRAWTDAAGRLVLTCEPYGSFWVQDHLPDLGDRWIRALCDWAGERGLAVELREPDARTGRGVSLHLRRLPRRPSLELLSSSTPGEAQRVAALPAPVTGRTIAA
jgi:hypothetical protein